jgi:hypothetical protein
MRKDERDFGQPIVSVSLGVPATFLFGGGTGGSAAARPPRSVHIETLVEAPQTHCGLTARSTARRPR